MKVCHIVIRNSYGRSYPAKAFLNKETALEYKEAQEAIDNNASFHIDTVHLEET